MNQEVVNYADSQGILKPYQLTDSVVQMNYLKQAIREKKDDPL